MKSCCEEQNFNCHQGKLCRKREAIWLAKTEAELDAELEKQWRRDLRSIVFIASCVLAFFLIVWGTLP
jgi:hypothetical protein